jgi:hypothetical protein
MTKFEYFKNWMQEHLQWEEWKINRDKSEWVLDENMERAFIVDAFYWGDTAGGSEYWIDVEEDWTTHLDEIDIDEITTSSFNIEQENTVVIEEIVEKVPNWNVSHVLAFYIAVTGKEHITTRKEKELLNDIIDVANSWEV